jgi:excinuclease UvrABC nuclease subunit
MLEGFVEVSAMLKPGIYALLREGIVVYVGQSKKPLSRVEAHRSLWGRRQRSPAPGWLPIKAILFDEVHVLSCRVEDLDKLERVMIDLYKPKYNVKLKSPHPVATEFNINIGGFTIPFNAVPKHPPILRRL